jgi:DNA cross-link repair 1A protein
MLRQSKITAFFRPLNSSQCNNESKDENEIQIVCNTSHKLNTKRKFNKLDSNQNKSLEKNSKHLRNGRICPFYKKVPNTRFAVDAFSYGSIPEISTYFLTHFHSDHYYGLKKSFKHIIYCSPITARLVRHHFRNGLFTIKELNLNETQVIDGIEVTFIDANHCPGAVMIVFVLPNGLRYLHTGDFRASLPMHSSQYLISSPIDLIFLDTTYCDPKYDFPPQKQTLDLIVSISCEAVQKNPKLLIVCGSYSIGKENVFISIAKALNLNVWTNYNKQKVYECYRNPEINSILVSNKDHSKLHVLPMNNINPQVIIK